MRLYISLLVIVAALVLAGGRRDNIVGAASAPSAPTMGFFVTSAKNKTGNLGQDVASLLERGAGPRQ
ncbi:MAG: hypothetical protein HYT78_12625 [Deltaproteobacteria bacterium]|nr:hypothetical protein [Deltaproteobacteria bacterium]